jgi:hypothetical protein
MIRVGRHSAEDLMHTAARCLLVVAVLTACEGASEPNAEEIPTSGPSFADITINGDAWVPETRFYFRTGDYLSIGFDRYVPDTPLREGIGLFVPGFTGEGSYPLGRFTDSTPGAGYGFADSSNGTGYGWSTADGDPGLLRITGFDPSDSTVAGTFRFVLRLDSSQPSRITSYEGSFRVRPSEQLP